MISSPRLDILRTVAPCFVGTIAFLLGYNLTGALAGFFGLVLLWIPVWRRSKLPDTTVCLGFGAMALSMIICGQAAVTPVRMFIIPSFLSAMAFGYLALNRPFTVAYAKEESPQEMWVLPSFMLVNRILTGFWGFVFLAIILSLAMSSRFGDFSKALLWLFPTLILVGAFQITSWYPQWHAKKYGDKTL